ncbi:ABC-2 type transport system permease protein [Cryptosporangium aurantiacum]|uniref:Transport permease protein n=2 Tax=Cryptosporangium aurantiacum TaxID=134849 RepID=A0A1M7RNJ4_9ACTN|nr:ABC-2 type transport system permease protein [Cryptosporangium aurantiacum]
MPASAPTPITPAPDRGTREWRAIRVLWRREMLRLVRNPMHIVLMLMNPLLFLFVLGGGLNGVIRGGDYQQFLFPGILVMAAQAPALGVGSSIIRDREIGFLRGMLVAPVSRGTLLIGKCLGGATVATVQACLLLCFAGVVGMSYRPTVLAALLVELAVVALALTTAGAFIAVVVRRTETFQAVLGLATMPLLFLSGALFPPSGLPAGLHVVSLINPLTYAVDALRRTSGGPALVTWGGWIPPVALELLMLAAAGVLALAMGARRFASET